MKHRIDTDWVVDYLTAGILTEKLGSVRNLFKRPKP